MTEVVQDRRGPPPRTAGRGVVTGVAVRGTAAVKAPTSIRAAASSSSAARRDSSSAAR